MGDKFETNVDGGRSVGIQFVIAHLKSTTGIKRVAGDAVAVG